MKPDSTLYRGVRHCESDGRKDATSPVYVVVDKGLLSPAPSQKLRNHSPDGFNWGYSGSGPSQLALAILLDFTGDEHLATFRYQDFKFAYVAQWDAESDWQIAGGEIRLWLERQQHGRPFEPVEDEPPYEDLADDVATPIERD